MLLPLDSQHRGDPDGCAVPAVGLLGGLGVGVDLHRPVCAFRQRSRTAQKEPRETCTLIEPSPVKGMEPQPGSQGSSRSCRGWQGDLRSPDSQGGTCAAPNLRTGEAAGVSQRESKQRRAAAFPPWEPSSRGACGPSCVLWFRLPGRHLVGIVGSSSPWLSNG